MIKFMVLHKQKCCKVSKKSVKVIAETGRKVHFSSGSGDESCKKKGDYFTRGTIIWSVSGAMS